MKRFALILATLVLLASSVEAGVLRTGFQKDTSSSADTVLFYTPDSRRFEAKSLWIRLDEDASGTVTVQRGLRISADSINFFDDAQTIEPGEVLYSADDEVYCFKYTKTASTDELVWSASTGPQTGIDSQYSRIAALLAAPAVRTVYQAPLFSTMDVVGAQAFTYPADGIPLDGAVSAMVVLQAKSLTSRFVLYSMISASAADTSCMTFPFDSAGVDSVNARQNATLETYTIPVRAFQGGVMQGYYHAHIKSMATTDIENLEGAIIVVY